jgi:hypothetical protein
VSPTIFQAPDDEGGHVRSLLAAVAALSIMIAGCGTATPGSVAPSVGAASQHPNGTATATVSAATPTAAPVATDAPATSSPDAVVDLSELDVCSLLTEADVQALTGTSVNFVDSGTGDRCFWGATAPGEPQYVEVTVFARPTGLTGYSFNPGDGCVVAPVSGVGAEAIGAICDNPQRKVHLLAADRGVAVQVLVNEPNGPLDPQTLGETVTGALEEITGS